MSRLVVDFGAEQPAYNTETNHPPPITFLSFCLVAFSNHEASMTIEILQITHPWLDDQDCVRTMAAARETSRFGRDASSVRALQEHQKTKTLSTYGKHVKRCNDEDWIGHNYELNKDSGFMKHQVHREAFLMAPQPTEVMRTIPISEHFSIGLIKYQIVMKTIQHFEVLWTEYGTAPSCCATHV